MKNTRYTSVLVSLLSVFGCSAAPERVADDALADGVITSCGSALESSQGVGLQGLSAQGLSAQGLSVQGLSVQGLSVQGLSVQGLSPQGLSPQGIQAQGLSPQGLSPQGIQAQGLSPQGLSPQGVQAQGLSPQGLSPQGIQAQGFWRNGFSAQGFSAQGMWSNGVSSQGVSAQGLWTNGLSTQGVSAQGIWSNGMSAQGMNAQGLASQGVNAQGLTSQGIDLHSVALRGVDPDQATRWLSGTTRETLLADQIVTLQLDKGVLSAVSAAGERLQDEDLVGLLLPFATNEGKTAWIDLTAVTPHPDAPELPLYTLLFDGESLCAEGKGGLFVPGVWDDSGAQHGRMISGGRAMNSTFSCLAGVIAKCVVWGYRPWSEGAEIHQVCTRMARADYCGDGVPHTENGTMIDMFDTRGIQKPVADDGLSFEAGWDANGAVCVREPRYVDQGANGEIILPSCWSDKPSCDSFTEAVDLGAKLGNDSAHLTRYQGCVVQE